MNSDDIIKILQGSIAPTVLISGVGLLLLCMTNRLGRSIDRIRGLCKQIQDNRHKDNFAIHNQIDILYLRCRCLQIAITLSTVTIICVSVLIFILFLMFILRINLVSLARILFSFGLMALIFSLIFFLRDIFLGLRSIKIEIEVTRKESST